MTPLDIFAWIVYVAIILSVVGVFISLAALPGRLARDKNHPQADAINIAGWLGLVFTLGIIWVLAMIWSQTVPTGDSSGAATEELDSLKARILDLESQLATSEEI